MHVLNGQPGEAVITSAGHSACSVCRALYRGSFERCPRDGGLIVPFAADDDPLLGATLGGRYVVEALIGEGATGRVYRACHHELPRRFALKVPFGEIAAVNDLRARFRLEAEAASRLDHANVVAVLDVGETDEGLLYLAMELVEGRELRAILTHEAPLEPERVIALARRMCRGLQHAHDAGMVHRDFKPENVLIVAEAGAEVPRMTDFGLAIPIQQPGRQMTNDSASIAGTPPYMSPEQLAGEPLDARSDLYSLGVVLYEMLAGVPPHDGTPLEIARKVTSEPAPPLRGRGRAVPGSLERIVLRLLERRPADRYAGATEVLAELDALSHAPRTRARPTTAAPPPAMKPGGTGELLALVKARRRPPPVLLAGVGALVVAAVAVVLLLRRDGAQDDRAAAAPVEAALPALGSRDTAPPAGTPRPAAATPPPAEAPPAEAPPAEAPPAEAPPPAEPPAPEPPRPTPPAARRSDQRSPGGEASAGEPRSAARASELYQEGTRSFLAGRLGDAKKKYQAALSLSSRYAPAHRGLGFVYQKAGDRTRALEHLRRYLELAPGARDAAAVRARIDALRR